MNSKTNSNIWYICFSPTLNIRVYILICYLMIMWWSHTCPQTTACVGGVPHLVLHQDSPVAWASGSPHTYTCLGQWRMDQQDTWADQPAPYRSHQRRIVDILSTINLWHYMTHQNLWPSLRKLVLSTQNTPLHIMLSLSYSVQMCYTKSISSIKFLMECCIYDETSVAILTKD